MLSSATAGGLLHVLPQQEVLCRVSRNIKSCCSQGRAKIRQTRVSHEPASQSCCASTSKLGCAGLRRTSKAAAHKAHPSPDTRQQGASHESAMSWHHRTVHHSCTSEPSLAVVQDSEAHQRLLPTRIRLESGNGNGNGNKSGRGSPPGVTPARSRPPCIAASATSGGPTMPTAWPSGVAFPSGMKRGASLGCAPRRQQSGCSGRLPAAAAGASSRMQRCRFCAWKSG